MPSIRRCLAWGRLLRRAIETYPEPLRVAVLGTGGLSHSIGEATMGWIDEQFDHACIKHFENGEEQALDDFLTRALPQTGNGAHEIRDWVVAHGAAGGTGFELIDYFPSPEFELVLAVVTTTGVSSMPCLACTLSPSPPGRSFPERKSSWFDHPRDNPDAEQRRSILPCESLSQQPTPPTRRASLVGRATCVD